MPLCPIFFFEGGALFEEIGHLKNRDGKKTGTKYIVILARGTVSRNSWPDMKWNIPLTSIRSPERENRVKLRRLGG